MATITLRRAIPTPDSGKIFGDGATVTTSRLLVVKEAIHKGEAYMANMVIALAYGDRVRNGDEVLLSDGEYTRLITVDFVDA